MDVSIRDDVKWHDGEQLTAKDIAFTYRFILDNGLSTFSDYLPYNPTFETPDDFTLVWKSEEPTLAPTVPPYIPIIPEHVGESSTGSPRREITSFRRHPGGWLGPVPVDRMEERISSGGWKPVRARSSERPRSTRSLSRVRQ